MSESDEGGLAAVEAIYQDIAARGQARLASGNIQADPYLIDAVLDQRRGLSVIAFPDDSIKTRCLQVVQALAEAEAGQFPYAAESLHLTVLNLVTVGHFGSAEERRLPQFTEVVTRALLDVGSFEVNYVGLVLAPDCVIVRGYPVGPTLERLRERLRQEMRTAGYGELLDRRYRLQTAHSTVFRFRTPLNDPRRFDGLVKSFANLALGTCRFSAVELIKHDWYMTPTRRTRIGIFALA